MAGRNLGLLTWQPDRRKLFFAGLPVPLESGAAELFAALAQTPGVPVALDRLQELNSQLAPLDRPALWELVATINRLLSSRIARGYYVSHDPDEGFRLVIPPLVGASLPGEAGGFDDPEGKPQHAPVIGRSDAFLRIAAQLEAQRFVTIAGPGGMGKTTVALALVRALAGRYADGVYVVDLSPLADERLVANAVGTTLGFALSTADPMASLAAFVRNKSMLVVLDSCEHVAGQAARIAEVLLGAAAGIHVLATSREPLMAAGEHLHRLPAMALPQAGASLTVAQAMTYSAVELFVQRVSSRDPSFSLRAQEVQGVASICLQLDGIPLALEIAAARAPKFGIQGLSEHLANNVLSIESEHAVPARHHTLAAMLDWSYHQLAESSKSTLRQLSIFRGNFSLDAATALVAIPGIAAHEVGNAVLDLVECSLLARTHAGGLRLLDTTRAYASAKLVGAEREAVAQRHAQFLLGVLKQADEHWQQMPPRQWLGQFSEWIDDVRLALEWSFSAAGDIGAGVELTYASFSLARQMSLDVEFRTYVERALAVLQDASPRSYLMEITLKAYLGSMGQRNDLERSPQYLSLEQILENEGSQISPRDQIIAIGAINHAALMAADFSTATRWTARAGHSARNSGDPVAVMIALRMQAQALHFMGRHEEARALAGQVLEESWRKIPLAYIPSPVEHRVSMRILLARIAWMQGFADSAVQMVDDCLAHAMTDTAISQCQALALCALPIALWNGDADRSAAFMSQLQGIAQRHSLGYWQYWAERIALIISMRDVEGDDGIDARLLKAGAVEANLRDHLCTFDARLFGADVAARVEAGTVGWCAPEILRIQAASVLQGSPSQAALAESLLKKSIALARSQRVLSWELRSSVQLAQLLAATGRSGEGRMQLGLAYAQFTEGFGTADLTQARHVMAGLESAAGRRDS